MELISTTPFGARPATPGLIAREAARRRGCGALPTAPADDASDKWALLRALAAGRAAFGISDRDLVVLSALLSFHPERGLAAAEGDAVIVHPSNAALAARAHGMAESTLRRHLAALVASGLIRRHDSPNGKRYAAYDAGGAPVRAFGFDLAPLAVRRAEIEAAARTAHEAELAVKRLRETIGLRLRDAEKLAAYGAEALAGTADWPDLFARAAGLRRRFRRRLEIEVLEALAAETTALAEAIEAAIGLSEAHLMSLDSEVSDGNAANFERHHQSSNPEYQESETCLENRGKAASTARHDDHGEANIDERRARTPSLSMTLDACPEISLYARYPIRNWRDLRDAADFVRPLLGVSAEAWVDAQAAMGEEGAAATLAAILERSAAIGSPGGYLRALSKRARGRGFSPTPMLLALINARRGRS